MLSFWEKQSFLEYDYILIGSGLVGLSAASCIKEKHPDKSVLVLERGIFPSGASTKNAGFACFGACFGIALNAGRFQGGDVEDKVPGLDARLKP